MSPTTLSKSPRRAGTTIRTIVIVLGILLVAMYAAVGFDIVTSRQSALDDARSEGRNLMLAFRAEVTYILRSAEGEMNLLAERMRRERGDFDLYAWGQESVLISPGIAQASIIGPNGKLITTTLEDHPSPIDLGDREHFRVHLDGNFHGLFIGKTIVGRNSGVPVLPISRRVDAVDGTFLGVLVVLISPGALTTLHKSIDLGLHGVMTLSGLDDVILARFAPDSPDGIVGIGRSIAGGPRPVVIGEHAEGWFVRTSVMDGMPRLYTYGRVGSYPLVVTVGLSLDRELAGWHSHVAMILAMAIGATLTLTGLAAYLSREIRIRATRDAELAEERTQLLTANVSLAQERTKLLATNIVLADSKERAEAANQAKSLFLANMSHELRTPLNAIIGYSEIIRDQTFGPNAAARYHEYAGDIYNSGHHLLKVIIDILDTAKLDAGKLELEEEIVDLAVLVDRSVTQVRLAIVSKRLVLELAIPDDLPQVRADASRLGQVLINLLSNAVKFTPEGGHIGVEVRCAEGEMICEVTDTGIGMSSEDIAVAREPFSQVENGLTKSYDGTGLGLPLAQRLVELHGGIIEIESEKGHGTTVRVRLPAGRTVVKNGDGPMIVIGQLAA